MENYFVVEVFEKGKNAGFVKKVVKDAPDYPKFEDFDDNPVGRVLMEEAEEKWVNNNTVGILSPDAKFEDIGKYLFSEDDVQIIEQENGSKIVKIKCPLCGTFH